jgi:hypothetical protein
MGASCCHLALVRRVAERRPDVQFVTYDRHPYRHWLGSRPDTAAMRNAWAASRVSGRRKADTFRPASELCPASPYRVVQLR